MSRIEDSPEKRKWLASKIKEAFRSARTNKCPDSDSANYVLGWLAEECGVDLQKLRAAKETP